MVECRAFLIDYTFKMHHTYVVNDNQRMHMEYDRKKDVKNILGKRYGRLSVLEKRKRKGARGAFWLCKCDCGTVKEVYGGHLRARTTQSCGCSSKSKFFESGLARIFRNYVVKAEKRSIIWNLSMSDLEKLITLPCTYCGTPPGQVLRQPKSKDIQIIYSGVDRVDSSKGYEVKNCVPCCKWCNISKSNRDLSDWLQHVKKIYNHKEIV